MKKRSSLPATARGIRCDLYRKLYREGMKQGFSPGRMSTNHLTLTCPVCGHIEQFSTTGRGIGHEAKMKLSAMRKHGLAWGGQPGKHVEEPIRESNRDPSR